MLLAREGDEVVIVDPDVYFPRPFSFQKVATGHYGWDVAEAHPRLLAAPCGAECLCQGNRDGGPRGYWHRAVPSSA